MRKIKHENLKPEDFKEHWQGCAKVRLEFVQNCTNNEEIFKAWPHYLNLDGYKLANNRKIIVMYEVLI